MSLGGNSIKSFIGLVCLVSFLFAMTWFYHSLATVKWDTQHIDICRFSIFGFGTSFNIFFRWSGQKGYFQKKIVLVCETVLILTYAIIILVYTLVISKPYEYLIAIDCGTLIAIVIIVWNAVKVRFWKLIRFWKHAST